jgi:hypothetical protein
MQNAGSGKHATVCKNHAEHATSSSCGWDNIEQTFHLGCVKWAVGSKSTKTSLQENTSTSLSLSCCYLTPLSHTDHTVAVGLAALHHFTSTAKVQQLQDHLL